MTTNRSSSPSGPIRVLATPKDNGINPYQRLLYTAVERCGAVVEPFSWKRLLFGQWHVWHLHWAEQPLWRRNAVSALVSAMSRLTALRIARLKGIQVVWTVHNLRGHDARHLWFEPTYWHWFLRNVDGIICLSRSGQEAVLQAHPVAARLPCFIISHGHYRDSYPVPPTREEARTKLGLDAEKIVVTFAGQLRPYKNVPKLIECFRSCARDNWRLVVAGRPVEATHAKEVEAAVGGDSRVQLTLRFLDSDELQTVLRASNVVILPFREILNSGSAILAVSFDCPVVVPNRGAMADLQEVTGPDWVYLYSGELDETVMEGAVAWATAVPDRGTAPLDDLDWSAIGSATCEAYRGLIDRTSSG